MMLQMSSRGRRFACLIGRCLALAVRAIFSGAAVGGVGVVGAVVGVGAVGVVGVVVGVGAAGAVGKVGGVDVWGGGAGAGCWDAAGNAIAAIGTASARAMISRMAGTPLLPATIDEFPAQELVGLLPG